MCFRLLRPPTQGHRSGLSTTSGRSRRLTRIRLGRRIGVGSSATVRGAAPQRGLGASCAIPASHIALQASSQSYLRVTKMDSRGQRAPGSSFSLHAQVECPICQRSFRADRIAAHADECASRAYLQSAGEVHDGATAHAAMAPAGPPVGPPAGSARAAGENFAVPQVRARRDAFAAKEAFFGIKLAKTLRRARSHSQAPAPGAAAHKSRATPKDRTEFRNGVVIVCEVRPPPCLGAVSRSARSGGISAAGLLILLLTCSRARVTGGAAAPEGIRRTIRAAAWPPGRDRIPLRRRERAALPAEERASPAPIA